MIIDHWWLFQIIDYWLVWVSLWLGNKGKPAFEHIKKGFFYWMLMSNKCSNAVMFAVIPIPILSHLRRPYGAKPLTKQIGSLLIIVDSSWWFLIIDPSELLQDKLWILDHSRIIWCSLIIHYWWLLNNWLLIINDYSRIIWWSLIIHYWWLLHLLSIIWNNLEQLE